MAPQNMAPEPNMLDCPDWPWRRAFLSHRRKPPRGRFASPLDVPALQTSKASTGSALTVDPVPWTISGPESRPLEHWRCVGWLWVFSLMLVAGIWRGAWLPRTENGGRSLHSQRHGVQPSGLLPSRPHRSAAHHSIRSVLGQTRPELGLAAITADG